MILNYNITLNGIILVNESIQNLINEEFTKSHAILLSYLYVARSIDLNTQDLCVLEKILDNLTGDGSMLHAYLDDLTNWGYLTSSNLYQVYQIKNNLNIF